MAAGGQGDFVFGIEIEKLLGHEHFGVRVLDAAKKKEGIVLSGGCVEEFDPAIDRPGRTILTNVVDLSEGERVGAVALLVRPVTRVGVGNAFLFEPSEQRVGHILRQIAIDAPVREAVLGVLVVPEMPDTDVSTAIPRVA